MQPDELLEKISKIRMWTRGDERAPHKPLLILYALGQIGKTKERYIPFDQVNENLTSLLMSFGLARKSFRATYPFTYLVNDGFWVLDQPLDTTKGYSVQALRDVKGGFSDEVYNLLKNNPLLIKQIAQTILESNFPESMHEDILRAVGLDWEYTIKTSRDPNFRNRILIAYQYSCAVCGFNVRLGDALVAVEAAHIKWHQAGGPDIENNGLALCSMHHKLFDRGAFTINSSLKIQVAQVVNGSAGLDEWLLRYKGKSVQEPQSSAYYPSESFINWHNREVFRGPARY